MHTPEKDKELVRVFGLCPWPHKFVKVHPHRRHRRFTCVDAFLAFVDAEAAFDHDWELYLVTEHGRPVVYATCTGR